MGPRTEAKASSGPCGSLTVPGWGRAGAGGKAVQLAVESVDRSFRMTLQTASRWRDAAPSQAQGFEGATPEALARSAAPDDRRAAKARRPR